MSSNSVPVPWQVEPPSSNSACRITYLFKTRLTIYVLPITVTSGPTRQPILSQRLRREAILDFTKKHLKSFENKFAIQFRVRDDKNSEDKKLLVDRLLLSPEEQSVTDLKELIDKLPKYEKQVSTVKLIKDDNGKLEEQRIYCRLGSVQSVTGGDNYWKMLDVLVKRFIKATNFANVIQTGAGEMLLDATPPSQSHARVTSTTEVKSPPNTPTKGVQPTKPITPKATTGKSATSSAPTSGPSKITIKDAPKVSGLFRIKPKLDPNQEKLHFELDMVPGIDKGLLLSELILSVFGRALSGSGIHHHLADIRGMLTGIVVSKAYQSPIAKGPDDADGQVTGSNLSDSNFATTSPAQAGAPASRPSRPAGALSDEYTIQDVQLARNVPSFLHTNGKHYSVFKYFKESKSTISQDLDAAVD